MSKNPVTYPIAMEYFGLAPKCRAVATGEKRKPKRGEWYLSGAIVEAYLAPADLDYAYQIARLVRVRQVWEIVGVDVTEYEVR